MVQTKRPLPAGVARGRHPKRAAVWRDAPQVAHPPPNGIRQQGVVTPLQVGAGGLDLRKTQKQSGSLRSQVVFLRIDAEKPVHAMEVSAGADAPAGTGAGLNVRKDTETKMISGSLKVANRVPCLGAGTRSQNRKFCSRVRSCR